MNESPVIGFARSMVRGLYFDGNSATPTAETEALVLGMFVYLARRKELVTPDSRAGEVVAWLDSLSCDGCLDGRTLEKYMERLALSFEDVRDMGGLKARLGVGFEKFYVEVVG